MAAALAALTSCSGASGLPDPHAVAGDLRRVAAATERAATIRAAIDVTITFSLSSAELTGTVDRTAAGFTFQGTSITRALGPARTDKLRVIWTGGRTYASSALLPGGPAWVTVQSAARGGLVTGSPTIDVSILDPLLYLHVTNPAYWATGGLGTPEDKGGDHFSAGCGGGSLTDPPDCDWAKLGSLFQTWHGALSSAAEDVWADPASHVVKRISANWDLYSIAQVPVHVDAALGLTTLPSAIQISPPAAAR
jgi:hypothetical protein